VKTTKIPNKTIVEKTAVDFARLALDLLLILPSYTAAFFLIATTEHIVTKPHPFCNKKSKKYPRDAPFLQGQV
jgi:hypothetical protein